ncbi:hypothetical protein [Streptomyces sp. NPDC046909]|uniref:hypothetical protein n=1 Tax=Streptomyces sp. NPDC046909 TaxID=3155617 RepID=UPI0033F1A098
MGHRPGARPGPVRSAHEVVPPEQWAKQVQLLVRDHPYDTVMAARSSTRATPAC